MIPTHPKDIARILAAVAACPFRGSVLPHTMQPECGCGELTECRANKGKRPGAVTLEDCVACRAKVLEIA